MFFLSVTQNNHRASIPVSISTVESGGNFDLPGNDGDVRFMGINTVRLSHAS